MTEIRYLYIENIARIVHAYQNVVQTEISMSYSIIMQVSKSIN